MTINISQMHESESINLSLMMLYLAISRKHISFLTVMKSYTIKISRNYLVKTRTPYAIITLATFTNRARKKDNLRVNFELYLQ